MNNLRGLYFDEYALSFLTQFVLALVMLFYLLRLTADIRRVWAIVLFFVAMALYAGVELVGSTAVWDRQFYFFHLRFPLLYIGLLAGTLIVYHFPEIPDDPFTSQRRRELRLVIFIHILLLSGCTAMSIYQWSQLKVAGKAVVDTRLFEVSIGLVLYWHMVVFLRRLWSLANQFTPRRWHWRQWPVNQQPAGRNLYDLVSVLLFLLGMNAIVMLVGAGLLPHQWQETIRATGLLLFLFMMSISYLKFKVGQTTFMVRIVGTTLLVIFLVLGLVGVVASERFSKVVSIRPLTIPTQTIQFTPTASGRYQATTRPPQPETDWGDLITEPIVSLPFTFPFGSKSWSDVNLTEPGAVAFGDWSAVLYAYNYLPAITAYGGDMAENGRIYLNRQPDHVTITWQQEGITDGVQVVLWADGRFQLTYPPFSGRNLNRIGFQSGTGGTAFTEFDPNGVYRGTAIAADGLLTDYTILQQQAGHVLMVPLVGLVLVFGLLSIIGFPLLFRAILVNPLQKLVYGVRQVEMGNLEVVVPVQYEDEIGTVTHAFNQMVSAVRDVSRTLETEIEKRTLELAESNQQLGALEERERIGREIHDDLGQVMGYVHMQVEATMARLRRNEMEQAQAILAEVDRVAQEAHSRVRHYILGIRTGQQPIRPTDLGTALNEYLVLAGKRYGLVMELTVEPQLLSHLRLTPQVETQLFRIVQEGITNVYRHAHATHVNLFLTVADGWLTLLLKDNGQGFTLADDTVVAGDHFGLQIMQERAESVNGRFHITSVPGQGTQLHLQLPCTLDSSRSTAINGQKYPWRVLLVDDHILFREGLGNMLRPHGIQIVGAAANGKEAESAIATLQPDLILMDIHMPEQDGLETTRRLKQQYPHIKIVMLTMAEDESVLLQALKYGASGYLLKNLPAPEFLSLLDEVMAGRTIVAPTLATQVLMALAQQDDLIPTTPTVETAADLLTERQQAVLAYVAQGMTNKQIGEHLHISENTVKYHIKQIMERLQLATRHELVLHYLDSTGDN